MKHSKSALKQKTKPAKIILTPYQKKIKWHENKWTKLVKMHALERLARFSVEDILEKKKTENRYLKRQLIELAKKTGGMLKSLLEDVDTNLYPQEKTSNERQLNRLMEVPTSIVYSSKNDLLESDNINLFLKSRN